MRYISRNALGIPFLLLGMAFAASDKDAGRSLFDNARKASDIRADGAPAFRMEANFKITSKVSGEQIEGRYTEIWASSAKWRREVEAGSFRHVEIGMAPKKWVVGSSGDRLEPAFYGPLVLLFSRNSTPDVTRISQREPGGVKVSCVESKTQWSKEIDCVDPQTGVFLLRETLLSVGFNRVRHSCVYRHYEKFEGRFFPRTVHCNNEPGDDIELTISKLVAEPSPEEALFSKPEGASESVDCLGRATPPRVAYSPDPEYPEHHKEKATVVLWMIIAVNGEPRDLRVVHSPGQDFDRPALETVRRWRFRPAMCDGAPIPVQINVEIEFRKF